MSTYTPSDVESKAIALVNAEKSNWQDMECYLTDKIYFNGKDILKKAKKNYFSIFDDEYDPITKRKKVYVPMSRDMVETTVKNTDLDTKDISVKAKKPDAYYVAGFCRYILSSYLDKIRFGQLLNRIIRRTCVEGTAVLEKFNENRNLTLSILENLNFYTDPTANYLKESASNIKESWLTLDELNSYQWDNLDQIAGQYSIARTPDNYGQATEVPYSKVTTRNGLVPKYLLTGDPADENSDEYREGVIIISNLNDGGAVVNLIAENTSGNRPYREFRTKMYDGRWQGIGICEDLFSLQAYINEIFNIRLNTARIKQLGLFEVRKGSGITSQILSQLYSGGGIPVTRIGQDIAELRTSDIKASSYRDEQQAYLWAQRITGAWEVGRGESLPATMPATTAMLQEKGMASGFALQQEELGFCISEFLEELVLPDLLNNLQENEILRITGDPTELRQLDENYVINALNQKLVEYYSEYGYYPSEEEIQKEKLRALEELRKFGRDRFIKIKKYLFNPEAILDSVDIFVTGESFNKMVLAKQLNDLLINYSRIGGISLDIDAITSELLDIMGLGYERFVKKTLPNMTSGIPVQPNQGQAIPIPPPQQINNPQGTKPLSSVMTNEAMGGVPGMQ